MTDFFDFIFVPMPHFEFQHDEFLGAVRSDSRINTIFIFIDIIILIILITIIIIVIITITIIIIILVLLQ